MSTIIRDRPGSETPATLSAFRAHWEIFFFLDFPEYHTTYRKLLRARKNWDSDILENVSSQILEQCISITESVYMTLYSCRGNFVAEVEIAIGDCRRTICREHFFTDFLLGLMQSRVIIIIVYVQLHDKHNVLATT